MSFHQSSAALTSRQAAIENLPADSAQQKKIFDDLFTARDRQREEVRKVREANKVRDRESAMAENLGIDPIVIKSMKMWDDAFSRNRYKASRAFTQFMIFSHAQGYGDDVEKPEDDRPVMDRTRTAQRLIGMNPVREGSRATYGMTLKNAYEQEVLAAAEDIYRKLSDGVPFKRLREGQGGGRPSKAWQEGYEMAVERLHREQEEKDQQERDAAE